MGLLHCPLSLFISRIVTHSIALSANALPIVLAGARQNDATGIAEPSEPPAQTRASVASDGAQHQRVLDLLAEKLMSGSGMTNDAHATDALLNYLQIPTAADEKTSEAWLVRHQVAVSNAMGRAVRDALPASPARDTLQVGLQDDLQQYLKQITPLARPALGQLLFSATLRLTEHSLEHEAHVDEGNLKGARTKENRFHEAVAQEKPSLQTLAGPTIPPLAKNREKLSGPITLTVITPIEPNHPLYKEISALSENLREFAILTLQHQRGTSLNIRARLKVLGDQRSGLLTAMNTAAARITLSPNATAHVQALVAASAKAQQGGWAPARGAIAHEVIHFRGGVTSDPVEARRRLEDSIVNAEKLTSLLQDIGVLPIDTTFTKIGDKMLPAINQTRQERDIAASKLTLAPSGSLELATLHQKQADFNVLLQALSSALRHEQRIAEMLINNIAR